MTTCNAQIAHRRQIVPLRECKRCGRGPCHLIEDEAMIRPITPEMTLAHYTGLLAEARAIGVVAPRKLKGGDV